MKRRDLVAGLGAAALAWPFAARAQQPGDMRRIAVLLGFDFDDQLAQLRLAQLTIGLEALGWVAHRNITIHVGWLGGHFDRVSAAAEKILALKPELIVCNGTPLTAALQRQSRAIPIVFLMVADPVGSGFVRTLSRPGGNLTGFASLDLPMAEGALKLLKDVVPRLRRVAVIFNPETAPYAMRYVHSLETAAPRLGLKPFAAAVTSESDLERVIAALGRESNSGLLVMPDGYLVTHRKPIIALAARHKVPTMYFYASPYVEEGGLISYGIDAMSQYRRAASHVDSILRGMNPAELRVGTPNHFEMAVNLFTARALGIEIPETILSRADRVIE